MTETPTNETIDRAGAAAAEALALAYRAGGLAHAACALRALAYTLATAQGGCHPADMAAALLEEAGYTTAIPGRALADLEDGIWGWDG